MLKHVRLTHAIIVLSLVPLLGMGYLATNLMRERNAEIAGLTKDAAGVQLATVLSSLVHNLQIERGATAGFVGSDGQKFGDVLGELRANTDESFSVLAQALETARKRGAAEPFLAEGANSLAAAETLADLRRRVDAQNIETSEAVAFFSDLNAEIIGAINWLGTSAHGATSVRYIMGYADFLGAKEVMGKLRAVGTGAFAAGVFTPAEMDTFKGLVTSKDGHLDAFRTKAYDEDVAALDALEMTDNYTQMMTFQERAMTDGLAGAIDDIRGDAWFDVTTKFINGLKTVEDNIAARLSVLVEDAVSASGNIVLDGF